jgi:DNA modification methylase
VPLESWPLARLKPDPKNPRRHPRDQIERLARAIKEFGFTSPILVDSAGQIIAGHGRLEAARLAELREVPVLVLGHLTTVQRRALLVWDNESTNGASWDDQLLAEALAGLKLENFDLSLLGFELDDLERRLGATGGSAENDAEEEAPPPLTDSAPAPWVKRGGLYALGHHRLLIGDSLVPECRAQLLDGAKIDAVVTDPPYAIYGSSSGVSSSIADDKMVIPFFETFFRAAADVLREFAHLYCFCDWRSLGAIYTALARVPALTLKNKLVWDKGRSGLGSNWSNTYEEVVFAHRLQPQRVMKGQDRAGIRVVNKPNLIRANRPSGAERLHNAAKPVGLLSEFVEASTDAGQKIWEPFAGSGSTLIAAEKLDRVCYAGEAEPANAQITIERWQRLTGKRAIEVSA